MPFTPPSLDTLEPVTTNRVTGFTPPPLSSMEGVKKTREQVMAEVGAAQGRMDVVNPPETQGWGERIAGNDLTGQLVESVNRLRPDLLLRDTLVGVSDPQRYIGGNGGIQAPSPIDVPSLSPEAAKKAIEFFTPIKAVEGGVGQGVQNFLAEMLSGLTTLPSALAMAGGLPKTTFPTFARTSAPLVFAPGMIQDSGHALQQATEAQGAANQTQAWLSALSSGLFPLMMAKHAGVPPVKPSGIRPGDVTDGRNPNYDYPGGGDLIGPARQLPIISESTFRENVNPKPKDVEVTVDPATMKLSREKTPINLPQEMGKPIPGQKQLPLVSESSLEALRNPVPVDRTFEGRPITAPDYLTPGEQRGAEYLGEGKLDLSTLSPEQQQKINEIVRQQKVRPASGPVPIIGESAPVEGANLGAGLVQPSPSVVFQNETAPVKPVYVPSRPPVEPSGGEISFRAPAGAEAVPNAGQSAPKGMQIKAAMERGQERRGETGSVFPRGDEGRVPEQAPKEDLAAKVRPMTGAQFREWSKSAEGGITAEAHRYGMGAKTQAQVDALKEGEVAAKGEMRAAMESGDMDGAMSIAVKGQFFREAHEAATGVGSAGEKLRKDDAGYKAPFPQGGMPPVEPKGGGIGSGINKAIEKNKEGGSVPNPFPFIVEKFKKKEQEKRGDTFALSGPRIALDPKESGFNDVTRKVDAQQLWNRVKNKLTPAEKDIYEKSGVDKKIVEMGKVSPEEAAEMLQEGGVEVRTHSYGMEGKVSEAKKEYDRMTHEWVDSLTQQQKRDLMTARADSGARSGWSDEQVSDALKLQGWKNEQIDKAIQYRTLRSKIADEPADTSPRATSAYDTVSAFSTKEPMPEWTKTKSSKNVQRVDVVVPNKHGSKIQQLETESQAATPLRKQAIQNEINNLKADPEVTTKWTQDNLHENLPNTPYWNMIQYKTGPKGEKIALIAEGQGSWIQAKHAYESALKKGKSEQEAYQASVPAGSGRGYRPNQDHPLLQHAQRLGMKAAIDQARKEGADHIVISDAETAMMTEGHDVGAATRYMEYDANGKASLPKEVHPEQEPGMRLNYDTILPKIMEELSGGKGERVSLGEHKNAMQTGIGPRGEQRAGTVPRDNLIFKNADGTPKTDVSGTMYKIPQTDKKFSLFEKDRPESVAGRLYMNPVGPIAKQAAKDIGTLGKKVKEVGTDFIRAYSEPLQEQMGRLGGPVGKKVSEEAGQIISRGKELYGELTPVIDPAKKQVGKMMREGTTWMRGRNEVTPTASFNNFFGVNEGAVVTPLNAKRGMKLAADANLAIGKMAERANPGFKASGKLQRIPTTIGYDFIVNGGEGRQRWIEGAAKLNNKPVADVQNFFDKMKQTLGDPSSDSASLDRINQDFTRKFPRTITHIKTATGWHEVVVSDPFNYLEQAAQRTAHSVAFREVYPLIQHQGQWVQSGKLQATRKAIMNELDKGSDIVKFDNLVKALQGHPLDTFKGGATSAIGSISGVIGSPLKALMLSANAPVNIGEVISGGPSIFMGYTTVGSAMKKLLTDNTFYDQLELAGARNKAMYNLALDPSSPTRSLARQVATGVRTLTGQQFLNEIQETTAAASAKVYSDAVKGGKMGEYSLNRAKALFRAMGFNNEQAGLMVKGDAALLKQFENRAAAWLTTGNQATGEMSRLGASRLFNAAFWFHKYPQMTMNQFRSVAGNWVEDGKSYWKKPSADSWSPLYHNSVLMGRLLGGRTFQGAITLGILAGISGGIYGLYQTTREAEEDALKFAGDSLVSGFGGPISVLKKLNQNVKGGESFTKELVGLSAPATLNQELIDMGMGVGRYSGMGKVESIATFLESKTPVTRSIKMGMAVAGLVEKDLELEVAMKAFYKWRREQPGYVPMGQMGGTEEQVDLRSGMQKVKKAIEDGKDWVKELEKVKNDKSAGNSLRAGTMLQLNGKALDEEQMKSLKNRLGANGLEKIKLRDAMVREVGRELNEKTESGEKQAPQSIKKPTGKWAVDYETDSVRSERVMGKLEPKVQEFLKKNEVEDVGYTPSLKRGNQKQELTMGQVMVLEDEYVGRVNQLVGALVKNKNLEGQTQKLRHTLISNMLKGAREIARAKSLGNIPEDPEQRGR